MSIKAFPNYTQITETRSIGFWHILRVATLFATGLIIYLLLRQPDFALTLFWKILIPLLPLSFAVVPGLWRNICPMAFLNQLPRLFGMGMQRTLPQGLRNTALLFSITAFIAFVIFRAPLFNESGRAVASVLILALLLALVGGWVFKGRSGWCGTFCPLAPLQKVYGHAPLFIVRNGYCQTCIGCQKNCYDFNPKAAIFSDLDDSDNGWSEHRKYFAAMLPGLIFGFFNTLSPAESSLSTYFFTILIPPLVSVGLYHTLKNILRLNDYRMVAMFALIALAFFYWNGAPIVVSGIEKIFPVTLPLYTVEAIRLAALSICSIVIIKGLLTERAYRQSKQMSSRASIGTGVAALQAATLTNNKQVKIHDLASDKHFEVKAEQTLLEAIETAELPIMSGCRMGMCGSDPVVITEGSDELTPPDENELTTLRRLGLEGKARLACCCKPKKHLTIDLAANPQESKVADKRAVRVVQDTHDIIVIIGNGIAGTSVAEHLRTLKNDRPILMISQEPHHFYNRMGLERVIHRKTAMQGLYLLKEEWYQRNHIDVWLNSHVVKIHRKDKQIELGSGEKQSYHKLVLASGGKAFVPPLPGFDLAGCFSLRDAADALAMRAWVLEKQCRKIAVLGGGVLGVEAADALRQLGLHVTLIHHASTLMDRQLDEQAASMLKHFLVNRGIDVLINTSVIRAQGEEGRVQHIVLKDNSLLDVDLLLICTGIRAHTSLAVNAGLNVNRGILVNDSMLTSDPDIYCVGDAAELPNAIGGLWAVGNEQGKVAAAALSGKDSHYEAQALPPVQLKVSGIDLKSFGSLEQKEGIETHTSHQTENNRWGKIMLHKGWIVGGVFVNAPLMANAAMAAATSSRANNQPLSKADIEKIIKPTPK